MSKFFQATLIFLLIPFSFFKIQAFRSPFAFPLIPSVIFISEVFLAIFFSPRLKFFFVLPIVLLFIAIGCFYFTKVF
jgi:hypothetical protein